MSMNSIMPLSMAAIGQPLRLVSVNSGRKLAHRLAELGMTPGIEMTIIQDAGGPILVAVRDSRIALGRGMAHKVAVELIA